MINGAFSTEKVIVIIFSIYLSPYYFFINLCKFKNKSRTIEPQFLKKMKNIQLHFEEYDS